MLHKNIERFKSGIYQIRNLVNNKCYIGSSVNLYNRFHTHSTKLKQRIHSNKHLESSYHKYGNDNFIFEVLEYCSEEILIEREQYYLDITEPEYNKRIDATNNFLVSPTIETRDKISKTLKKRYEEGYQGYKQEKLNQEIELYDKYGNFVRLCNHAKEFSLLVGLEKGNYTYEKIKKGFTFRGYQARIKGSQKRIYSYMPNGTTMLKETVLIDIKNQEIMIYPNISSLCVHNNLDIYTTKQYIKKDIDLIGNYRIYLINNTKFDKYKSFKIVIKFTEPISPE